MDNHHTITEALDRLAEDLVQLEAAQGEEDKPALELVQLVAVDVQDALINHQATPNYLDSIAGAELADTAAWLAAYRKEQPDLVTRLTGLLDATASDIFHQQAE